MTDYKIKAVLFDLDGTLIDSAPEFAKCLNLLLKEEGREQLHESTVRPWISEGSIGLIECGFEIEQSHPRFNELRDRLLIYYESSLGSSSELFPGMEELLSKLAQHNLPWGIVTNKPKRYTNPLLNIIQTLNGATAVVSGDTLPKAKPHPEPLLLACRQMGIAPEQAIYIGDAPRDIEAAVAANMPAVVAGYGYIGDDHKPDTWGADHQVENPLEIFDLVKPRI